MGKRRGARGKNVRPGRPGPRGGVLRPFRPGESGNPGGRPRGLISSALRVLLAGAGKRGDTVAEDLAQVLLRHAEKGTLAALREILGRTEGRWPTSRDAQAGEGVVFVSGVPRPGDKEGPICKPCGSAPGRCAKCGEALTVSDLTLEERIAAERRSMALLASRWGER